MYLLFERLRTRAYGPIPLGTDELITTSSVVWIFRGAGRAMLGEAGRQSKARVDIGDKIGVGIIPGLEHLDVLYKYLIQIVDAAGTAGAFAKCNH